MGPRRKGSTAFPVARIKKMMQSDDDVGKIATVTPVLVAKALELMMEHVLHDAAQVAKMRHTRTVTPQHLRQCVLDNEAFDFLRPTLAHVKMDATEGGGRGRRRGGYGGGRGRKRARPGGGEAGVKRGRSMDGEQAIEPEGEGGGGGGGGGAREKTGKGKSALESLSKLPPLTPPVRSNVPGSMSMDGMGVPKLEEKRKEEGDDDDDEDYDEDGGEDDLMPDQPTEGDGGRTSGRVSVHALLS